MLTIKAEVQGLKETQAIMEKMVRDLEGPPIVQAMRDATMLVTRSAKQNAPVDTGRLRASIVPEVRSVGKEVQGIVGSNVLYAPFMELGTRPHFPPLAPLIRWVHRKRLAGTYSVKTRRRRGGKTRQAQEDYQVAYMVALAISRRGLRARRYLQEALEQNEQKIVALIGRTVARIVSR